MLDWLRAQVDRDEQTAVAAMYSRDSRWETDGEGGLRDTETGGNGYFAAGP